PGGRPSAARRRRPGPVRRGAARTAHRRGDGAARRAILPGRAPSLLGNALAGGMMVLAATNVSCGYRRAVLTGVSLTVRGGELSVILGPNGSGKTTLLRTLARLVRPLSGTVTMDGKDVWSCSPSQVAAAVAFTSQVLAPDWPFTVREFVALGRAPHRGWWRPLGAQDRRVIDATLDQFGLCAVQDRPVTELSGGEWQRVRLARGLTQEARVLLPDEPTTHLDPRYQLELLSLVRRLVRARRPA